MIDTLLTAPPASHHIAPPSSQQPALPQPPSLQPAAQTLTSRQRRWQGEGRLAELPTPESSRTSAGRLLHGNVVLGAPVVQGFDCCADCRTHAHGQGTGPAQWAWLASVKAPTIAALASAAAPASTIKVIAPNAPVVGAGAWPSATPGLGWAGAHCCCCVCHYLARLATSGTPSLHNVSQLLRLVQLGKCLPGWCWPAMLAELPHWGNDAKRPGRDLM